MLKKYYTVKQYFCFFLNILILLCLISSCDQALGMQQGQGPTTKGKVIVLVGEQLSEGRAKYFKSFIKNTKNKKEVIFAHVRTVQSQKDYLKKLSGMKSREKQLTQAALEAIDKNKWDKAKDEFVILGFKEQGLAALGAAEELRKKINLTKAIVVSAPLKGYDFYDAEYHQPAGAIGQLLKGMRQATCVEESTLMADLTPGSEYLKKIHDFIESQKGEKDLKIYIADASARNLCDNAGEKKEVKKKGGIDEQDKEEKEALELTKEGKKAARARKRKLKKEVKDLLQSVSKTIREKYHKTNSSKNLKYLPGVEEFMVLWKYLQKKDKQAFYDLFKQLNGGKDHDGLLSVDTQRGGEFKNKRVQRGSFDGYGGTIFIPYKELNKLKSLGLFTEGESTWSNTQLQEALTKFILE